MAAFRELEAFAQLGSDLDPATQARLDRGYRMNRLLIQGVCQPLDAIDQIFVIYAGTKGFLDRTPIEQVGRWEKEFLPWLHANKSELWNRLKALTGKLGDEETAAIEKALNEFNAIFDAGRSS